MLQITASANVPDTTYFRTDDAEPSLENGTLTIKDGTGSRRSSWGEPGIHSTVVLETSVLVAVHVGFFHKHGGGQFWRYYRHDGEAWLQVRWTLLSDSERQQVLEASEKKAPSWAKTPGKLRATYAKPVLPTSTTYKIVEVIDAKYFSVYDGKTEYVLGKRLAQAAVDDHGAGYYSYPTVQGVMDRFHGYALFPERCYNKSMQLSLIECEVSGTIIEYDNGKIASSYLRPLREVQQFSYTPALQEVV